jgi:hypothetical protein
MTADVSINRSAASTDAATSAKILSLKLQLRGKDAKVLDRVCAHALEDTNTTKIIVRRVSAMIHAWATNVLQLERSVNRRW